MLRALKPIIVKEFRQVSRDRTSLGMLLALPAALIILVGFALNFDVKHIPLVIYDQDKSSGSREYLEMFKHTEYFDDLYDVSGYPEIEEHFLHGRAKIAIVVPVQFSSDLLAGRDASVQILVDGADANTSGQAVANATRMTLDYSTRLVAAAFSRTGRQQYLPIDFQPRIWYNPDLRTTGFLLPGLIGVLLVLTPAVSASMTGCRGKE